MPKVTSKSTTTKASKAAEAKVVAKKVPDDTKVESKLLYIVVFICHRHYHLVDTIVLTILHRSQTSTIRIQPVCRCQHGDMEGGQPQC